MDPIMEDQDLDDLLFESSQEPAPIPSDEKLGRLGQLAEDQVKLEREAADLENQLKVKKAELFKLSSETIPTLMGELKLTSFKMMDGSEVTVKEDFDCAITQENSFAALSWLREKKLDEIIKNEFKLDFGKGQENDAAKLQEKLKELGYTYSRKEFVHPQTLGAFVRRRMEARLEIPTDLFSIHPIKKTKIKRSK